MTAPPARAEKSASSSWSKPIKTPPGCTETYHSGRRSSVGWAGQTITDILCRGGYHPPGSVGRDDPGAPSVYRGGPRGARLRGGRASMEPPPGPRGYPRNTPEAVGIGGIGKGRAEFYRFVTFGPGVLTFGAGWFIICPEARGVILAEPGGSCRKAPCRLKI